MALIVFRADAGPMMGSGHVMRTRALAAAFVPRGWQVGLAATKETFESVKALNGSDFERLVLDVAAEKEPGVMQARWPAIDILVVDHYNRDAAFERACRAFAKRLVVIDDLADRAHDCDLLVDSNAMSAAAYRSLVPAHCRALAGPAYAALDPAFRQARAAALVRRDGRPVERVLVSFGQMDLQNATALALRALERAGYAGATDVVLGGAAPHLDAIRKEMPARARLHIDTADMPALMTEADFAFGAGGTTSWERCCLGLPALLVEAADNQRGVIAALERAGAAVGVGPTARTDSEAMADVLRALLADGKRRMQMAIAGASLVDGRGAERILLAAVGSVHTNAGEVTLRLAEADDEGWLLELQQKPETRKFANNPRLPEAGEHASWLRAALADPSRLLMIAEAGGKRAAMLRLDRGAEADRVNIATDPAYHRRGIGRAMLGLAARISPGRPLDAQVLSENCSSLALFQSMGYRQIEKDLYRREPR